MKIAFLIPANFITGGVLVAYRQAHFLAQRGHSVEILFVSDSHGTVVKAYPDFSLKTSTLERAVRERKAFDVVIATWWETFYDIFKLDSSHYLYFCQSDERRFYPSPLSPEVPFVELTYLDNRVGIITEGKWIRNWLTSSYGARVAYAPNGIDTRLFNPQAKPLVPRSSPQPNNKIRLLIEGSGALFFKRVDLAFQVANRVRREMPSRPIEIWYASSDGVCLKSWQPDRIFKKVPYQEMPAIYRSCDILIKLSTVEGVFGPPLEMMACGGASVVSKVTGFDEYVVDGVNALAVDIDNAEGAFQAVKRLIDDPALRERIGQEGIQAAGALDWGNLSQHFEQGVLDLTKNGHAWTSGDRLHYLTLGRIKENTQKLSQLEKRLRKVETLTGYRALAHAKHVFKSWKPWKPLKSLKSRHGTD